MLAGIEEALLARTGEVSGTDDEDNIYESLSELWSSREEEADWYRVAEKFWNDEALCPLSDDGVLGGYSSVTEMDSRDSHAFLDRLSSSSPPLLSSFDRCADCGAGIGRVSKYVLLQRFAHVDLVEQSGRLLEHSIEYLGAEQAARTSRLQVGLQAFTAPANTYDCIWIQWVIGHLTDKDFVDFFKRCAQALKPGGLIVLKDNVAKDWTFVVDLTDRSVARSREYLHVLFAASGLQVALEQQQTDFPPELYPVYMTALTPKL